MAHFTLPRSFWTRIDKNGPVPECAPRLGPCWLWTGSRCRDGYGRGKVASGKRGGRTVRAHRAIYIATVGPIPDGLVLDHLCRVRHCVRPSHLEPVTNRENILRGDRASRGSWQRRKTHCKHGHEFTPENTRWRDGRWRTCVACVKRRQAEHRERLAV